MIFQLSQECGIPFLIHHEAEDGLLPELEAMLQEFPGAKVVWCHVGRRWDNCDRVFQTFRAIVLPALPREVAEKIAFKNARVLMTGQPWQD